MVVEKAATATQRIGVSGYFLGVSKLRVWASQQEL